jgi:hypothetical protein
MDGQIGIWKKKNTTYAIRKKEACNAFVLPTIANSNLG